MGATLTRPTHLRLDRRAAFDAQREGDHGQDGGGVAQDLVTGETKDCNALGGKVGGATVVVSARAGIVVLATVELDGEAAPRAEEGEDEWAAAILAAELEAGYATAAQVGPQGGAGVGGAEAEAMATQEGRGAVHAALSTSRRKLLREVRGVPSR